MNTRRGGIDPLDFARASARPSAGVILAQRRQSAGWLLSQVAAAAGDWSPEGIYAVEQGTDVTPASLARYAQALDRLAADPPCEICHVAHSKCHPEDCAGHFLAHMRGDHP